MGPGDLSSRHPKLPDRETKGEPERLAGGDWEMLDDSRGDGLLEESSVLVDKSPGIDEDSEGSDKWDEARQSA